jgi:hypothetical integral membrane protein (TIGR02206 family)
MAVYLGFAGGLHSILTPELTQGDSNWMLFDYYITHSMLILISILLTFSLDMKPRKNSALHLFFILNIIALIIYPLDRYIDANYMYVAKKPIANSPILIGDWPWYLISLEVALIVHLYILDILFRRIPKRIKN